MKTRIFIYFVSLSILFCVLYGFQRKQETIKPLEHEVTVELVVVEVFVTDKDGHFVENLTQNDFEIYEDGKRVDIQYFAVVTPHEEIQPEIISDKVEEKKSLLPPQEMRLVVLFDNINSNRFYLSSQWPHIKEMIKNLSGKVEETMIMELSRYYGARIIQPFTSDQSLLSDVISTFQFDLLKSIREEAQRFDMEDLEREARKRLEDRFIGNPFYIMDCIMKEDKFIRRQRLSDSFGSFLAAVDHIRKFKGTKAILLVSDGFHLDRKSKKGIIAEGGHYKYVYKGVVRLFDPFKLFGGKRYLDQDEAFEKLLQLINEERLIFYAFSPKELKEDFSVTAPSDAGDIFKDEMEQWEKERYSLERIADETGGMYLRGQKKYENFAKELGRDLTHFYDISYLPPKKRKKGYHTIEVKVKRPELKIRYKKGYSDFTDEQIERRRLASAFLSPSLFKDIAFSCKTDFIALRGGFLQFWIRLKVPLGQFRENRNLTLRDEMTLLFGINEWKERRIHTGGRMLRIKEAIEKNLGTLYRAYITSLVDLKPGDYETRLVIKQGEDRMGGWEAPVSIPDVKRGKSLSLLNVICGFLIDEEEENAVPFSVSIGDGSLLLSRHKFYPFVENIIKQGRRIALLLQICNPRDVKGPALQFFLQNDRNTPLNLSSEKMESYFDKKLKILSEVYVLDFQDIPPADYKLKIKSSDGRIEKTVEIKAIS